eukprot:scaffold4943_cov199-Skeletonema_marinoi.AAC.3
MAARAGVCGGWIGDRRRHDCFFWKRKKVVDGSIWPEHQKSPTSTSSKLQPTSPSYQISRKKQRVSADDAAW